MNQVCLYKHSFYRSRPNILTYLPIAHSCYPPTSTTVLHLIQNGMMIFRRPQGQDDGSEVDEELDIFLTPQLYALVNIFFQFVASSLAI